MTTVTWNYYVDWNRNGDYTDSSDDITAYVQQANFNLGFTQPFQDVAGEAICNLRLSNDDGRFSPESTLGTTTYGQHWKLRPVKIEAVDSGGGTTVMYTGYTDTISPDPGSTTGSQTATLTARCVRQFFDEQDAYIETQENINSGTLLTMIVEQIRLPVATANGPWVLGLTDYGELGTNTYLQSNLIQHAIGAGQSTFSYAGDTWGSGVSILDAITDTVRSERGRFYIDRSGSAIFWDRQYLLTDLTNDGTVINPLSTEYSFGENIANTVEVDIVPRSVDADTSILWSLDEPLVIHANSERTIRANFSEQDSNSKVAGLDVVKPTEEAGSLTFSSGEGYISKFEENATSASISIAATTASATVSQLDIYGRKLTTYNRVTISRVDGESKFHNGEYRYRLNLSLLDDEFTANNIALYELRRRKDAMGQINSIMIDGDTQTNEELILALGIGNRINVQETKTSHNADYFIVGENHTVTAGEYHTVTFYLEPANNNQYWNLGVHTLGETTTLAF